MGPKPHRKPKKPPPKLTATERKALEYEALKRLSKAIPQKLIKELLGGKETRRLKKQADLYGLAWGGRTIDLGALLRSVDALLQRIAPYYSRWIGEDKPEASTSERQSPALERCREIRAKSLQLQFDLESKQAIPREQLRTGMREFARIIRGAGERLQQRYGRDAQEILDKALTDAVGAVERSIGNQSGGQCR